MHTNKLRNIVAPLVLCVLLQACGGGGGDSKPPASPTASGSTATPPSGTTTTGIPASAPATPTPASTPTPAQNFAANVLPITVDKGTSGTATNRPYVSVRICEPGSTTACLTLDHVLLDTGSVGMRVTYTEISGKLNLPTVTNQAGATLAECTQFSSGYQWGSVRQADVYLGSLLAARIRIHAVGDTAPNVVNVPSDCSSVGPAASLSVSGAKAIIGVYGAVADCGIRCATNEKNATYYFCPTTGCQQTAITLSDQIPNPVAVLPTDNNGTVIALPSVSDAGETSLRGTLTLGIGTRDNNQLGNAKVYRPDAGNFIKVNYKGITYESFIDSGTPRILFTDPSVPTCNSNHDVYCPSNPLTVAATAMPSNSTTPGTFSAKVDNADLRTTIVAAYNLGAISTIKSSTPGAPNILFWGAPFFYGKTVATAIADATTPAGKGPYWAF